MILDHYNEVEIGRTVLGLLFNSRKVAQFVVMNCSNEDFVLDSHKMILEISKEILEKGDWFNIDSLIRIMSEKEDGDDAILEIAQCGIYGVSDEMLKEWYNELKERKMKRKMNEMLTLQISPEEVNYQIESMKREFLIGEISSPPDVEKTIAEYYGQTGEIYNPGWHSLNEILKFESGLMSVLTGVPSIGKTLFLNCLSLNLVKDYNIKIAYFCPEYKSKETHFADLIKIKTRSGNLNKDQITRQISEVNKNIQIIDIQEEGRTVESIFGSLRPDTKFLIIDPWNEIEATKSKDENKTDYIGRQLKKIKAESKERNIHTLICAHPAKPVYNRKGEVVPVTLYSIADSAHWYNKPDLGFRLDRNKETNITTLTVLKVRYADRNGIQGREVKFVYSNFQFEEMF